MSAPSPIDELEARIRALPATLEVIPNDGRAIRKLEVLAIPEAKVSALRASHGRRVRSGVAVSATAAAGAAILVLNLVAAYFAPAYGRALADAPGVGPISSSLLYFTGLGNGNLTFVHQSVTSSGHTVELVAGYADGLRTVLFVQVDGKGLSEDPKQFQAELGVDIDAVKLTDQFGRTYPLSSGAQIDSVLTFDPLQWPAADLGGRMTLHVGAVRYPGAPAGTPVVSGDWTLHLTLFSEPAHTLALPAPIHTDQADYRFTLVRESETTLIIHWTVTGPVVAEVNALVAQMGFNNSPSERPGPPPAAYTKLMRDYFFTQLFDASGNPVTEGAWGYEFSSPVKGSMEVFIPGPGHYRLEMGDAMADQALQRWIVAP